MSMRHTLFLFGEAEKGDLCTPLLFRSLPELADRLGNPPEESEGILYAVQALLYERELIFFRIREEGFSHTDYMRGLHYLESKEAFPALSGICMPGVGSRELIEAAKPLCDLHQSCLIISEKDLYDYLTVK